MSKASDENDALMIKVLGIAIYAQDDYSPKAIANHKRRDEIRAYVIRLCEQHQALQEELGHTKAVPRDLTEEKGLAKRLAALENLHRMVKIAQKPAPVPWTFDPTDFTPHRNPKSIIHSQATDDIPKALNELADLDKPKDSR